MRVPTDDVTLRRNPLSSPHTRAVLSYLLPDASTLRLDACQVDSPAAQITLRVRSTQTTASCPLCATPARRIHSDYGRTLADSVGALPRPPSAPRPQVVLPQSCLPSPYLHRTPAHGGRSWARRTLRLAHRLGALGVALGGTAGVQLGHQWDLVVSRNTLLRLLRKLSLPAAPRPGCSG